jgi:hypothetical protein
VVEKFRENERGPVATLKEKGNEGAFSRFLRFFVEIPFLRFVFVVLGQSLLPSHNL